SGSSSTSSRARRARRRTTSDRSPDEPAPVGVPLTDSGTPSRLETEYSDQQAGCLVVFDDTPRPVELRILRPAPLLRDWASRMEPAAARDPDGVGSLPAQDLRT